MQRYKNVTHVWILWPKQAPHTYDTKIIFHVSNKTDFLQLLCALKMLKKILEGKINNSTNKRLHELMRIFKNNFTARGTANKFEMCELLSESE